MESQLNPDPFLELAIGAVGLVVVIFVHGAGIRTVNRRFSRAWLRMRPSTPRWRIDLLLGTVICSLTALHLCETLVWAAPLHLSGVMPDLRDAYFSVLGSYTTLGAGAVQLPERWRLIGPIIAMSGLFTFGWTASVLVSIMTKIGQLDAAQARFAGTAASRNRDGETTVEPDGRSAPE